MPALLTHCMFDVSLRTKLSVSVLAQRKIESARPRKHGLFLRTEEKMRLYGRTLATFRRKIQPGWPWGRLARDAENCKVGRKRN